MIFEAEVCLKYTNNFPPDELLNFLQNIQHDPNRNKLHDSPTPVNESVSNDTRDTHPVHFFSHT